MIKPCYNFLNGRTAIITGSGQNIGKAIALSFATHGANVVINGHRDKDAVETVAEEARQYGVQAMTIMADVSDPHAVQAMVDKTVETFGMVDIAISNAGIRPIKSVLDITVEEWHNVLNTNLSSAFYMARAVVPHMTANRWGRIIHMSGHNAFTGTAKKSHITASRAGLQGFSKSLAHEVGAYGITVNVVSPGAIDTHRHSKSEIGTELPDEIWYQNYKETLPVRRIGTVEDIAEACLYLVKDTAGFVTGQVIHVNGGIYMA